MFLVGFVFTEAGTPLRTAGGRRRGIGCRQVRLKRLMVPQPLRAVGPERQESFRLVSGDRNLLTIHVDGT